MKLVIERETWLRGDDTESFLLRQSDGKKCCLGFLALQCGLQDTAIKDVGTIAQYALTRRESLPEALKFLVSCGVNSIAADELMVVNDNKSISDSVREKNLTAMFAKNDIQVEFV